MSNSGNENDSDNETNTVDNTEPDEGRPSSEESTSEDLLQVSINFDNLCSICLNEVSVTSYADGCLHKFCGRCIFEWARRSQLCPICRTFFGNIITNVLSDTDYEVIPLEERRVSVFNFMRDSWRTNNNRNQPSNRNIFAVRQFSRQPHNQGNQQPRPQLVQNQQTVYQDVQQDQQSREVQSQPMVEMTPVIRGMDNLYIENRRPRRANCGPPPAAHPRIIWASNRYHRNPNRPPVRQIQRNRPSPPSTSPPPPPPQPVHQSRGNFNSTHSYPASRASFPSPNRHLTTQTGSTFPNNSNNINNNAHFRRNQTQSNRFYNDRGHYRMVQNTYGTQNHPNQNFNNNINYHRSRNTHQTNVHSYPQRPLRPLVGIRQENLTSSSTSLNNQNQNNPRPNHQSHNDGTN